MSGGFSSLSSLDSSVKKSALEWPFLDTSPLGTQLHGSLALLGLTLSQMRAIFSPEDRLPITPVL